MDGYAIISWHYSPHNDKKITFISDYPAHNIRLKNIRVHKVPQEVTIFMLSDLIVSGRAKLDGNHLFACLVGFNEFGTDDNSFIQDYELLIRALKTVAPQAHVLTISLFGTPDMPVKALKDATIKNGKLKKLAACEEQCSYMAVWRRFQASAAHYLFDEDQAALSVQGNLCLAEAIAHNILCNRLLG